MAGFSRRGQCTCLTLLAVLSLTCVRAQQHVLLLARDITGEFSTFDIAPFSLGGSSQAYSIEGALIGARVQKLALAHHVLAHPPLALRRLVQP